MAAREAARPAGEVGVWCRWRLSLPLVLLSRREHAAKARGAPAIGGDWWRASAGIGGHRRALAGIGGRGGGGDFGEIRGRSFRHACWAWGVAFVGRSGFACRRADEPTSRRADEPTSRRADEPTRRHADGSTVPSVYESIPVSPMQSRRLADSPIHRFTDLPIYRFTDLPIYRFTDSPAHAARRCRGPAARSVRSSAPAFIPPRHDGRPPSPGRSKPHGGAAISAAHRAPPPSIPSKLTAVVSHEFFSCLS
ncbi:Uncharacterised protein [Burkholderia pseudomallei]|nr:Uncharacterised protein [Burkholderia pseudomallei]VBJ16179.1 Uncharacterised protein [Burkholderia pseudomallei]